MSVLYVSYHAVIDTECGSPSPKGTRKIKESLGQALASNSPQDCCI